MTARQTCRKGANVSIPSTEDKAPSPIAGLATVIRIGIPALLCRWRRLPPGLRVPALLQDIWRTRPDLQVTFDLARRGDRGKLISWLMFHGFREMCLDDYSELRAALMPWHRRWPRLPILAPMPITWLMREAARREGFTITDLREVTGQLRLLRWYFLVGMAKYGWTSLLTDAQAAALTVTTEPEGTPRIVAWLWDERADLRASFDQPSSPALLAWLRENGAARWPVLADPRILLALPERQPASAARPFGVNLVGHPRGRFGIGEDVRMAARALAAAGVPFVICDHSAGTGVAAEDSSVDALISDAMPYRFTMFCTTGMDTVRIVKLLGGEALEGQTLIGFWPWELLEYPQLWRGAYALVDEVWASSRYTHDAYARSSTVPLRHMPMAVTYDETAGLGRADFGLPAERFLFVFAYDALSHNARKNPEACLAAFDLAFPRGDEPVGLVIKGLRAADSPAWRALEQRAAADPRLFLLGQSLERAELLDLYRACDAFVSLHRAEGFGRNIAECMGLGLPVVVTAHSGNMDFTRSDTAALVPADLRPLAPGDYPYADGQIWAEPDVAAAARLMQRLISDDVWRESIARAGQARIAALYAPEVVGRHWREALRAMAGG